MYVCPHVHVHITEFPLFSFLLLIFCFLLSWEDSSDSVWPYPQIKLLVLVKSSAGRMAAQAGILTLPHKRDKDWQQSISAGTGYTQLTNIIHIFPNQLVFHLSAKTFLFAILNRRQSNDACNMARHHIKLRRV